MHRIGRTGRARREGVAITLAEPRERGLLRNIERLTTQRIEIATVPTVADLRAHRLEQTRGELRATILAGDLDAYRAVAESLTAEFDALDIAAAALKQGGARDGVVAEEEIPITPTRDVGRGARDAGLASRRLRRAGRIVPNRGLRAPGSRASETLARLYIGAGRKAEGAAGRSGGGDRQRGGDRCERDRRGADQRSLFAGGGAGGGRRRRDRGAPGHDDQGEARPGEAGSGRAVAWRSGSGPALPSTTAALRWSPRSFARFIGEPLNFSLNSSCVIATSSRASVRASFPAIAPRAANGLPSGSARENFSFHGHTSWQMSQP